VLILPAPEVTRVEEENMLNLNTLYKLIKSEEQRLDKYVETYSQQRRSRHDL
jgi:hypothetical protein